MGPQQFAQQRCGFLRLVRFPQANPFSDLGFSDEICVLADRQHGIEQLNRRSELVVLDQNKCLVVAHIIEQCRIGGLREDLVEPYDGVLVTSGECRELSQTKLGLLAESRVGEVFQQSLESLLSVLFVLVGIERLGEQQ